MSRLRDHPPRWTERFLGWALPSEAAEEIVGDLREEWKARGPGMVRTARHIASISSVAVHFLFRERTRLGWRQHLRLAFRRLRREPTFSAVATAAIALGIGVNVLMLGIAETVLFAPLPYPEEDRLAVLTNDHSGSSTGGFGVAYASIRDVREQARGIESVALYMDWQDVSYEGSDGAVQLPAAFVSNDYVETLGLSTSLGRFFSEEENRGNAPGAVAVLGQGAWRSIFGRDPAVIGRKLVLNGSPYQVIGVVDDDRGDLRYLWGQAPVAIYLPLFAVEPLVGFDLEASRGNRWLNGIVRVREGTAVESAEVELGAISAELAALYPRTNEGWSYHLEELDEAMFEELRTPTSAVLGISVLVFLLVAVNLLTLVLLRAAGRRGEAAVRQALGAGRGRIFAQLLSESLVLALLGWVAGAMLGAWGLELFAASDAVRLPEFVVLALDARVLMASAAGALFLALLLAVAPAVDLLRSDGSSNAALLRGGRGSADRGRVRVQTTLVAAEVALACVLLAGAGLLLDSFRTLHGTGYGFDTDRLLLAQVDVRGEDYEVEELVSFTEAAVVAAEALPGAADAFIWSPNRLGHGNQVAIITQEGRWEIAPDERIEASLHTLHPGTLRSLGIRLVAGRDVAATDGPDDPRVAWVSESLARALWPGQDPLGRRVETVQQGQAVLAEVVGVVSDARHRTRLIEPFEAQRDIYYPYAQEARGLLTVAIRHVEGADVPGLVDGVRSIVREMSPSSPVYGVTTMAEQMRAEEGPSRLGALLVAVYAILAVALAALGLYGVLAHGVQLQLREIGIRMALGADRGALFRRVVQRGMLMTLAGLVAGALLAVPVARLLRTVVYGEGATMPLILGLVCLTMAVVAFASCAIPAQRAVRVAPSDVLRAE